MLNRIRTYLIIFSAALSGCKPRVYTFKYENDVTKEFFKPVSLDKGGKYYEMDSVEVYSALLREQFVNRGSVAEFKIVNDASSQEKVETFAYNLSYKLCIFRFYSKEINPRYHPCMFMAIGYGPPDETCIRLGPVYTGTVASADGRINFKKQWNIKKRSGKYVIKKPCNKKSRNRDIDFIFFDGQSLKHDAFDTLCVKEILDYDLNKIGGSKTLIYDTPIIFKDKEALLFQYETTITK